MLAVKYGSLEAVKTLIDKGAKLDIQDSRGHTALDFVNHYKRTQRTLDEEKAYQYMEIAKFLTDAQQRPTSEERFKSAD